MDDLQAVATVLAGPEPSAAVTERGRRRLADTVAARGGRPGPRGGRTRRRWPVAAGLLAAAAAGAVATSVALPSRSNAPHQTRIVTAAWTVTRNAEGAISIRLNQAVADPAGLERALRSQGVTVIVKPLTLATKKEGTATVAWWACEYRPLKLEPSAVQRAVILSLTDPSAGKPGSIPDDRWTINPAAMPPGSVLLLQESRGLLRAAIGTLAVLRGDTLPSCAPNPPMTGSVGIAEVRIHRTR